jgi:predicted short-subunit dehydrogenase-like oxidoreductase (DUF2520 family)
MGSALAAHLPADGPFGRGFDGTRHDRTYYDVVVLAVPDAAIAAAAALVVPGPLVVHCSGSSGLDVFAGRRGASMHPLMTVTGAGADFTGAVAAVDATDAAALGAVTDLARALGMRPIRVGAQDRVAYHAAATIASNYVVTVLDAAARLLATAGPGRQALGPLVEATVGNWLDQGADALTGPVRRGDEAVVAAQRAAVSARAPEMLALFDELTAATRALAARIRVD